MKFAFSENFRGHGCLVEGQVSLGDILLFADLFPLATDKILRHGRRKIFLFLTDIIFFVFSFPIDPCTVVKTHFPTHQKGGL